MTEPKTIEELLELGERVLADSTHVYEGHDQRDEAEELLAHCLGIESDDLDDDEEPPRRVRERYLSLIARRAGGEPFPLLVGYIEFWGLELKVRDGTFMPRPSSELLVERAAKKVRRMKSPVVVDLATGSGPIALALADELPQARVYGSDIDAGGLALARENARALGLGNVVFRRGDMYGAVPSKLRSSIDLITGHIPYVPADELDDLPSEVREHEPEHMLTDASDDGLGLVRQAVYGANEWLAPGGWLMLEISDDFAERIGQMCRKAGLADVDWGTDEDELSYVVQARRKRS